MASTIRCSKFDYEFFQSRKGAKTSNETSERSRPAITSGAGVLSIPLRAWLTKPPRCLMLSPFFERRTLILFWQKKTCHPLGVDIGSRTKSNFTSHFQMNEQTPFQKAGYVCTWFILSVDFAFRFLLFSSRACTITSLQFLNWCRMVWEFSWVWLY